MSYETTGVLTERGEQAAEEHISDMLMEYSKTVFNIDFESIKQSTDSELLERKITYLRNLITELQKMKHTKIDLSKYVLSMNNLLAIRKLYPHLKMVRSGPMRQDLPEYRKEFIHPCACSKGMYINNDSDHFIRSLSSLQHELGRLTTQEAQSLRLLQFSEISYNYLIGNKQNSASSGVLYCSAPRYGMMAIHNSKRIYLMSEPSSFMEIKPKNSVDLLSKSKTIGIHDSLESFLTELPDNLESDVCDGPISTQMDLSTNTKELTDYQYRFLNLSPIENLVLNRDLFSAWPSPAYSHSHFSNDNNNKFTTRFCRGSNTFDGKLNSGLSNVSQLSSWLCDVALFAESINVIDSYSTPSVPPLVQVCSSYNNDHNPERIASGGSYSPGTNIDSWRLTRYIPEYKLQPQPNSVEDVFNKTLVTNIRKADELLKTLQTAVFYGEDINKLSYSDLQVFLQKLSDRDSYYLVDPTDTKQHYNGLMAALKEFQGFGEKEYIYNLISGTGLRTRNTIKSLKSCNRLSTTAVGLPLLASEIGTTIDSLIDMTLTNQGAYSSILATTYMNAYVYRQTLYTYLLGSIQKAGNSGTVYLNSGFTKAFIAAITDTYFNLHHLFGDKQSIYKNNLSFPLTANGWIRINNDQDIAYSNLSNYGSKYVTHSNPDYADTIMSIIAKGDKFFNQLDFLQEMYTVRG